jgi:hypothetical protein
MTQTQEKNQEEKIEDEATDSDEEQETPTRRPDDYPLEIKWLISSLS